MVKSCVPRRLRRFRIGPGNWKVSVQFSEPPEFRGVTIKGDLEVKPDLGDTALRFDGTAQLPEAGSKKLTISGLVTFNHAAPYTEQGYTASFSWSEDGRVALAKGDFKGKNLVMDVSIFPGEKTPMSVRVVGDNPRRVICTLPKSGNAPAVDWMTITLTR